MLTLSPAVKIYLATEPTDMRKGFDGLCALVKQSLGRDVYSGHLFVFVSRRRDRIKVLAWDRGGFVLWYKRLEQGRFRMPQFKTRQRSVDIDAGQLAMLLDGIDFSRVRRPRRWQPPRQLGIDRSHEM
jgi:transposase